MRLNKKAISLIIIFITGAFLQLGFRKKSLTDTLNNGLHIIPKPFRIEPQNGNFNIQSKTQILVQPPDKDNMNIAKYLTDILETSTGLIFNPTGYTKSDPPRNTILLSTTLNQPGLEKEGYSLSVSSRGVQIKANTARGLFYGVQTFSQLLPAEIKQNETVQKPMEWSIPSVQIDDKPRFAWRGMLLDVSRHFRSKEFILKYIDYLAMYKFNKFHLHLTDDQGWRIEIKKYPKLTSKGAWRADRMGEPWWYRNPQEKGEEATYGGFYTQAEIQEIVQYAKDRFITVIPEIDMPGHSRAAIASYPEYSCSGKFFPVSTGGELKDNTYCSGKEETFLFLEDILSEVIDLFPSEYIHIGGDECNKSSWKRCRKCRARMRDEGLTDLNELQSYFITRISKFLKSKNRKLIGWDEILEGGLTPDATVMSWRGIKGGIAAAQTGHDVVMAPNTHVYFDLYQGIPKLEPEAYSNLPLSRVYTFDPVPEELSQAEKTHILGGQGCLWGEFIWDDSHAEYMTFPRLFALSECLWTPPRIKNWENFVWRMENHFSRLDNKGINYSRSAYNVTIVPYHQLAQNEILLFMRTEIEGENIHFTLDGTNPAIDSNVYDNPIRITSNTHLKAAVFKHGKKFGKLSEQRFSIHKALTKNISLKYSLHRRNGGGWPGALLDGMHAGGDFSDHDWRSLRRYDFEAVIDLGRAMSINSMSTGFLQEINRRIFLPESVEYAVSSNGKKYRALAKIKHDVSLKHKELTKMLFSHDPHNLQARYIRVRAKNIKTCPDWHPGAGEDAWLYLDEIVIE